MTQAQPETLDLTLLDGITTYVQTILCADIIRLYGMGRVLCPFGVALGTLQNDTTLPRPQVMVASTPPSATLRITKKVTRLLAKNSMAAGTILAYFHQEEHVVVVQLEHREFGDMLWTARVSGDGKLGEFSKRTPLADARYEIKRTELLPERWMH